MVSQLYLVVIVQAKVVSITWGTTVFSGQVQNLMNQMLGGGYYIVTTQNLVDGHWIKTVGFQCGALRIERM